MGLCRCRNVTPLFCFEHRKNVCEACTVRDHQSCIVKSYLQWLQDSDYDTRCSLCNNQLVSEGAPPEDLIRLSCLDLFHGACLERQVNRNGTVVPLHDAKCPTCMIPIATAVQRGSASPLADQIQRRLARLCPSWAAQLDEMARATPLPADAKAAASNRAALTDHFASPRAQPNTTPPMVTIDIGHRPEFQSDYTRPAPSDASPLLKVKRPSKEAKAMGFPLAGPSAGAVTAAAEPSAFGLLFQGRHAAPSGRLASVRAIVVNFLTLRNLRSCGLGSSPRRVLLLFSLLSTILLFGFLVVRPLAFERHADRPIKG